MPHWRRTLYTVWFTEFIAIVDFNFVIPFIPYYIQEFGVSDRQQVALWAGLATLLMSLGFATGGTLSTLTALLIQFSPQGREGMVLGWIPASRGLRTRLAR